jgi:uncharacterized damage-inducible protein DinB
MTPDQAKFLCDYFTDMIERESKATKRVIEAVTDSGRDYRPDPKSRTAWELANHLAQSEVWFLGSVVKGSFQFDPEHEKQTTAEMKSVADVAQYYDRGVSEAIRQLRALPGEKLAEPVDFFGFMHAPNATYLGFANNHTIHHRGQLAAYLRALGSKVPDIFGGSADEPFQAAG